MIKSPLRYPGGKSRAIKEIVERLPKNFSEYREPFVGGGSLFIYLKQKYPDLKIWINDLNSELFLFWKIAQTDLEKLTKKIFEIKNSYVDGKLLFQEITNVNVEDLSSLERGVRFFVLNRITFSGTAESGGFSQQAFNQRFTLSSIERLKQLGTILENIKITNLDYSYLLEQENKNLFLFLDPPYYTATKSKLYGKKGNLHTSFDHKKFSEFITQCSSKWLITYDNCSEVRNNFKLSHIQAWELQYGMNNYRQDNACKGKELFISNYPIKNKLNKDDDNILKQLSLF